MEPPKKSFDADADLASLSLTLLSNGEGATPDVNGKEGMKMTRVRVESFTISLDGYGAGPDQDIGNPLGVGGTDLHQWLLPTRTLQRTLFGASDGTTGIDDDFAARGSGTSARGFSEETCSGRSADPGPT